MMCVYIFIYSVGIYSWHSVHINLPDLATEAEFDSLFHKALPFFLPFFSLPFSVINTWIACEVYSIDRRCDASV